MTIIGTNKRGAKVKINPTSGGGFTLSLIAKNGTGWAAPVQTIAEAKVKAELALGPLSWSEK
ncbi:MAG: hypothetical protein ABFD14_03825 [Anaerolineaceae bacterium]